MPTLRLGVAVVVVALASVVLFTISRFLYRRAKAGKLRFSLRALMIAVAIVSVILGTWFGYLRATMAQLTWLSANSARAERVFPKETVRANGRGGHAFLYYPRRQTVGFLARSLPAGNLTATQEALSVTSVDEASADALLKSLRSADVLPPGAFVIRGRVTDSDGQPLVGATVDLMGPFVFINHFHTRNDGTFAMPLFDPMRAPPGDGYYLRIRASDETGENVVRWHMPSFSLDTVQPERVALIVVPR